MAKKIKEMEDAIANIRTAWESDRLGPLYRAKVIPTNVQVFTELLQEYVSSEVRRTLPGANLKSIEYLRDSFLEEWTRSQLSGKTKYFQAPTTTFMFLAFHGIRLWAIAVTELLKVYWAKKSGVSVTEYIHFQPLKKADEDVKGLLTVIGTLNPDVDTIKLGIDYLTSWMEDIIEFIKKD